MRELVIWLNKCHKITALANLVPTSSFETSYKRNQPRINSIFPGFTLRYHSTLYMVHKKSRELSRLYLFTYKYSQDLLLNQTIKQTFAATYKENWDLSKLQNK